MLKLAIAAIALSASMVVAAQPSSGQCDMYSTWIAAFAIGRDQGKTLEDIVGVIRDADLVNWGAVKPGTDQDAVRRLFVRDAVLVYNQDRYLSPDNIRANRYIACMNPRG